MYSWWVNLTREKLKKKHQKTSGITVFRGAIAVGSYVKSLSLFIPFWVCSHEVTRVRDLFGSKKKCRKIRQSCINLP